MSRPRGISLTWIWWGVFGFVLLVMAIALFGSGSDSPASLGVGDHGVLRLDGEGPILLAVDVPSYEGLVKACVAGDDIGLAAMILTGGVFECPQGTRVLVIDRGTYRRQVRLLDGPQAGAAGWVSGEWVRPQ